MSWRIRVSWEWDSESSNLEEAEKQAVSKELPEDYEERRLHFRNPDYLQHDPIRQIASTIIDKFEDLLIKHNIKIPNKERKEYERDEETAPIFGSDYYKLEDFIVEQIETIW